MNLDKLLGCFKQELFYRVSDAQIVLTDVDSLENHYQLGKGSQTLRTINQWFLDEAAIISAPHLHTNRVNNQVSVNRNPVVGYRPPRYGRACTRSVSTDWNGNTNKQIWLDLKGTGINSAKKPSPCLYKTGLLPLPEALNEYAWSRLINAIFIHSGAPFRCMQIYAIIDLGFSFDTGFMGRQNAAICVRRGHFRNIWSDLPLFGSESHTISLTIELLLRRYGVTSVGDVRVPFKLESNKIFLRTPLGSEGVVQFDLSEIGELTSASEKGEIECVNIQLAHTTPGTEVTVVDLGHFQRQELFTRPLMATVSNAPGAYGGILWPHETQFCQPSTNLIVPESYWGWTRTGDNQYSRTTDVNCQKIASDFTQNNISSEDVKNKLHRLVDLTIAKWGKCF